AQLADKVDFRVLQNYKQIPNYDGTIGTVPSDAPTYLQSGATLDNEAVPRDGLRRFMLSPNMQAKIVNGLKALYNPQVTISEQFKKGLMTKDTFGGDWYMDQNVATHTVGALGTAGNILSNPLFTSVTDIKDANGMVIGSAVVTSGWDANVNNILNQGDVI